MGYHVTSSLNGSHSYHQNSYWRDENSIVKWKANLEHIEAQKKGQKLWYKNYKIRIAKVERDYEF